MKLLAFGACALVFCSAMRPAGCGKTERPYVPPPPREALQTATAIPYTDSEAFDVLLEAALNRGDPVIVIQTSSPQPDWSGRLNAWIAAWNAGGPVRAASERTKGPGSGEKAFVAPGALPPDTAAETRKFLEGQIDRMERLARESVSWWRDEQRRKARVSMLHPYVLRIERGQQDQLQVVLNR
jgi:hypothetical protein